MRWEILIGGKAGQGPNLVSEIVSHGLIDAGFYVFYSRDYQSLIRGGHNFNQISFSRKPLNSNSSKTDVLVCFDSLTKELHKKNLKKNGKIIDFVEGGGNIYYAGRLFRLLGIEFKILEAQLRKLGRRFEENLMEAKKGYSEEKESVNLEKPKEKFKLGFANGSNSMARSALKSGLDFYYAYPMTPATAVMTELGTMQLDEKNQHKVIELENEIAVALAGIGSSAAGKIAMVGTSGGGFDLMTESLSFSAIAEIPIVYYLSQRPGPGTGVATYTSQGDLNMALHSGHGEFFRLVSAPGDNEETIKLTNEAFNISYKYRIPSIILGDKHLSESKSLFDEKVFSEIKKVKSNIKLGERFNSYESDSENFYVATEDAKVIKANFEKRLRKQNEIEKEIEKFEMIKIYGKKNSKNLILGWGSTKGAILDAISENKLDVKFIQVLYMSPFPTKKVLAEIKKAKKVLVVENNSESPLSRLVAEKTGFIVEEKNKILRYDGRPFFADELGKEFERGVLK